MKSEFRDSSIVTQKMVDAGVITVVVPGNSIKNKHVGIILIMTTTGILVVQDILEIDQEPTVWIQCYAHDQRAPTCWSRLGDPRHITSQ